MGFKTKVRKKGKGIQVLEISGDFAGENASKAAVLLEEMRTSTEGGIAVDLKRTTFIDSVGLEALLVLYGEALALGGEIKVSAPTEIGRDILKATRLQSVIEVHPSTPEARRSFV